MLNVLEFQQDMLCCV